ncbi:hypothetical protein SAMN04488503_1604 [Humidesulfovibrio mexicanus]|uniref:Uracil DNA glycosylase superfamily protein n=1 Tax=Humidesulfovibrio mexicanus TaxID=147047 RepID=A0A238ZUU3_9BACT|nr:hypothetical protein SAMN04488503_1604 [Humidesulfovibrio mexicanus]
MGSLATFVDLPEQLRPWADAGLTHLLVPGGLRETSAPLQPSAQPEDRHAGAPPTVPAATTEHAPFAQAPIWPEPWKTLAGRVRTAPRVIITYAALADDVSGAADPARRRLFQTMLAYIGWPAGTALFWPISFPSGAEPGARFASDIFAQGVEHFGIRHVLCFGPGPADRVRTLFPEEAKRVQLLELPDPSALLPLLPHELHIALARAKALRLA